MTSAATIQETELPYCASRWQAIRRRSRCIQVGSVAVGGDQPIRIQSMTTTVTQDVPATVAQCLELADAGCEIIRITAPNKAAASALKAISEQLRAAKCSVPLVADIHFLPAAAMEAAKYVEKVRINPGNYADKKKFAVKEYSEADYQIELERLHEAFSPLVLRCKEYGRALRIGTNHGSLSDRIMNRFGDTPLGMVESALEFIRIAESHQFHNICLSMKASNPKVMIAAYRLAVARMQAEDMHYPLHLGVTEAGDGEDARIKSAIGIGSLLCDGLGDTIRVSLTEDPINEIPVAQALARKAQGAWQAAAQAKAQPPEACRIPETGIRRPSRALQLGKGCTIGAQSVPAVVVDAAQPIKETEAIIQAVCRSQLQPNKCKIEALLLKIESPADLEHFNPLHEALQTAVPACILELSAVIDLSDLEAFDWPDSELCPLTLLQSMQREDAHYAAQLLEFCRKKGFKCALNCSPQALAEEIAAQLAPMGPAGLVLTYCPETPPAASNEHAIGVYRQLAQVIDQQLPETPIWIRNHPHNALEPQGHYSDRILEYSVLSGSLLCEGIGDLISIETEPQTEQASTLGYNILQGARARITKTEFVACPSCGRTLFDLQAVTQRIRAKTDHLKGVTIAIMGCIVNGPGEMADADFGYVGGAPGKVNLYVGKDCVQYNVPETNALDQLIALIKAHKKWTEPVTAPQAFRA